MVEIPANILNEDAPDALIDLYLRVKVTNATVRGPPALSRGTGPAPASAVVVCAVSRVLDQRPGTRGSGEPIQSAIGGARPMSSRGAGRWKGNVHYWDYHPDALCPDTSRIEAWIVAEACIYDDERKTEKIAITVLASGEVLK